MALVLAHVTVCNCGEGPRSLSYACCCCSERCLLTCVHGTLRDEAVYRHESCVWEASVGMGLLLRSRGGLLFKCVASVCCCGTSNELVVGWLGSGVADQNFLATDSV